MVLHVSVELDCLHCIGPVAVSLFEDLPPESASEVVSKVSPLGRKRSSRDEDTTRTAAAPKRSKFCGNADYICMMRPRCNYRHIKYRRLQAEGVHWREKRREGGHAGCPHNH